MTQLLLIRHANVLQQSAVSAHEWQLSANGRSRTIQLAHSFTTHPTRLITSTETKAVETGQILADIWGIPCASAPNLHEHDRQGVPYLPDQTEFENTIKQFFAHPDELIFGNETAVQALARFRTAVVTQLESYPADSLGIVTHGTVMTLLATYYNPTLEPFTFWQNLSMPDSYQLTI
ncbi:MAG: histidine phosphatase family protein [Anaerolineae bacterium]|nr:histidine phosphatase family protein [Anaerolineae bacterium]